MKKIIYVNEKKNIGTLIISLIITLGTGYLSYTFTKGYMRFYNEIKKPVFSPPPWVFSVVWTILFLLMGLSLYRILMLKKQGKNVNKPLLFFIVQLILNFLWPVIFFKQRLIALAFIELIILIIFIVLTIISFYKEDKLAAYLLVPYFVWCLFAAVLNFCIFMINE